MDQPQFVISPYQVTTLTQSTGLTILQLLPSLVKSAQKLARPPISKYHVGTVGLGSSGTVYLGGNLEFPGLPLHHSVHAEQFLVTNAAIHGEERIEYIAVSSAPCGHCRQFLQELRDAKEIKVLVTNTEDGGDGESEVFRPISEFLPHRFGPDDLLDKDVPLLLEPHNNRLNFINENNNGNDTNVEVMQMVKCNGGGGDMHDVLTSAALEAANNSHAPYSGCPSGVALIDVDGNVFKGSYMESAAYNPSLGPVQAAVIAFVASGGGKYSSIVSAVLVEKEGAVVQQEGTARLLLSSVSPKCDFRVFHCGSDENCCKKPVG